MTGTVGKNTEKVRDLTNLLIGMFVGGLAGFATMLLFAPRSGKTTRERISQKSAELQGRVSDTFDELLVMSQFDNRRIMIGPDGTTEDGRY